jgi:hypothetical protein
MLFLTIKGRDAVLEMSAPNMTFPQSIDQLLRYDFCLRRKSPRILIRHAQDMRRFLEQRQVSDSIIFACSGTEADTVEHARLEQHWVCAMEESGRNNEVLLIQNQTRANELVDRGYAVVLHSSIRQLTTIIDAVLSNGCNAIVTAIDWHGVLRYFPRGLTSEYMFDIALLRQIGEKTSSSAMLRPTRALQQALRSWQSDTLYSIGSFLTSLMYRPGILSALVEVQLSTIRFQTLLSPVPLGFVITASEQIRRLKRENRWLVDDRDGSCHRVICP